MRYYLIVGEASGDLHASHLMKAIASIDNEAEFRFFGGDNMTAVGGTRVRHFKELAYMGFIPVLLHLPTILRNMKYCQHDILAWQPHAVILVDYAGFNLKIAKFLRDLKTSKPQNLKTSKPHIFYYIAPKIWAWKEYRIKNFKRDVDEMFSILPFEVDFFEKKHNYPIHYVGNPTADEVRAFLGSYHESHTDFCARFNLNPNKPLIALLAGSRRQEIKDNLPHMIEAVRAYPEFQPVLACAPGIEFDYYQPYIETLQSIGGAFTIGATYDLLANSTSALVTSGTATLETALFNVPQVVCYKTPLPHLLRWAFNHIIKCKYISLVNLIADSEVVQELFADRFSIEMIKGELGKTLPGSPFREQMLKDYRLVHERLGKESAPQNAARQMVNLLIANK